MTGNPRDERRERGRRLAHELVKFIRRETPDRDEAGEVMLGAYEVFDRQTRTLRGESPFPPEAGNFPPYDSPH
jgi:hypothetical protein